MTEIHYNEVLGFQELIWNLAQIIVTHILEEGRKEGEGELRGGREGGRGEREQKMGKGGGTDGEGGQGGEGEGEGKREGGISRGWIIRLRGEGGRGE